MAVVAIEVKERRSYAQGVAFGNVGPYEVLEGSSQRYDLFTSPAKEPQRAAD